MAGATGMREHVLGGMAWTGASKIAQQMIRFAITAVLARLLLPRDFGLVGLIAVFTGFAAIFVDFGFGGALIQRRELEPRHLSSAFWLNLGAGIALCLLTMASAPLLAAFYGEPRLLPLTMAIAVTYAIAGTAIVQSALLQRSMNFRRVAFVENVGMLVGGCIAIGAAYTGRGVWSLVVLNLVTVSVRSLLLWSLSSWRPAFAFNLPAVKDLWGFSSNLAGVNALNYWSRNADNLLVGKFIGVAALGIYTRAYSVMLMPLSQVYSVTSRVMFPALSKLQDDPDRIRRAYLRGVGLIGLVTFPCAVGLFVAAKPFVIGIYGPRWGSAVTILQILCVPALIQSVTTTVSWIYQARGRTDWMFRWNLVSTFTTIASFVIGLHWGLVGISTAYAVRTVVLAYWACAIPGKLVAMTFSDIADATRGVLVCALAMGAVVWLVGAETAQMAAGLRLLVEVTVGVLAYGLLLQIASPVAYREALTLLGSRRGRKQVASASSAA